MWDPHSGSQPRKRNPGVLRHHPPASTQASAGPQVVLRSLCACGCVKVTTSPLGWEDAQSPKSSAPSAFYTEALFRQAGIYLAQGRDRGQRQQCPALSAEEVVSQGEKKRQQQKFRDQNCRKQALAAHQPRLPLLNSLSCLLGSLLSLGTLRKAKLPGQARPGLPGLSSVGTVSLGGPWGAEQGFRVPHSQLFVASSQSMERASSRRPVSQGALFSPMQGQEMTPN